TRASMQRGDHRPIEAAASPPTKPDVRRSVDEAVVSAAGVEPNANASNAVESNAVDANAIGSNMGPKPELRPRTTKSAKRKSMLPEAPVGKVIADRYRVISVLGEGGMGVVYRCRDLQGGTDVAL